MKRYIRNIAVNEIDIDGQEKLNKSTALVIGAGGLGCHTLYHLASLGFKNVIVMDHDTVSISNLQRQILFSENSIGKNKALEATKRLSCYNKEVSFYPIQEKFESLKYLIEDRGFNIDIIFDCTDNYNSRITISKESQKYNNIPVVFASVVEFQGWVFPQFYETENAKKIEDIISDHPTDQNCNSFGVINPSVAFVASIQAMEGLKLLLGLSELENHYIDVNCFTYQITKMVF